MANTHDRKVSVTGLGYVGLPVAVAFAQRGRVIGFDISQVRIKELQLGVDRTREVHSDDLRTANLELTFDPQRLSEADFHIVAVPTPVDDANQPDLRPLISASESIGAILKKGDIVVYESTVYPGVTEEICVPVLERRSGLKLGQDFGVGYSPERINPGDREHSFDRITKVVSGNSQETLTIVARLYGSVVRAGIHVAASIKVAEAAKVIENIQRDVNIALMNELAMVFHKLQIDTSDVLVASQTKWNFIPFKPGFVGGHCIGVDPYYLTHKAAMLGYTPQVILSGRRINDEMGSYVASQVVKGLVKFGKAIRGSRVTILGLTFKENVPDLRNTRVIDLIRELEDYGIDIQVHDPHCDPEEVFREYGLRCLSARELKPATSVVVAVAHRDFISGGWSFVTELLQDGEGLVVDIKGMLPRELRPSGVALWRL